MERMNLKVLLENELNLPKTPFTPTSKTPFYWAPQKLKSRPDLELRDWGRGTRDQRSLLHEPEGDERDRVTGRARSGDRNRMREWFRPSFSFLGHVHTPPRPPFWSMSRSPPCLLPPVLFHISSSQSMFALGSDQRCSSIY